MVDFSSPGGDISTRPTHPIHVVLASHDRRFLKVASFLLARQGADVVTTRAVDEIARLAGEHCADLVVLDCGDSLGEAADVVGDLRRQRPELRVVVVSDSATSPPRQLAITLWPKWDHLESLLDLVCESSSPALASLPRPASG